MFNICSVKLHSNYITAMYFNVSPMKLHWNYITATRFNVFPMKLYSNYIKAMYFNVFPMKLHYDYIWAVGSNVFSNEIAFNLHLRQVNGRAYMKLPWEDDSRFQWYKAVPVEGKRTTWVESGKWWWVGLLRGLRRPFKHDMTVSHFFPLRLS